MKLVPVRPPGPNRRKARAFAAEIRLLRVQGHTFESIREALAAAGVRVSNSTVQREAARAERLPLGMPSAATRMHEEPILPEAPASPGHAARPQQPLASGNGLSGRDIAEAFVRSHITNPLIRAKEPR